MRAVRDVVTLSTLARVMSLAGCAGCAGFGGASGSRARQLVSTLWHRQLATRSRVATLRRHKPTAASGVIRSRVISANAPLARDSSSALSQSAGNLPLVYNNAGLPG